MKKKKNNKKGWKIKSIKEIDKKKGQRKIGQKISRMKGQKSE